MCSAHGSASAPRNRRETGASLSVRTSGSSGTGKKMRVRQIILLFIACTILGCASHPKDTCTLQAAGSNVASLGSLHTRNCIVRLETGGKISILDLDGNVVALSLSKSEFQGKFPQLYEAYETAIASDGAEDIIIDASL